MATFRAIFLVALLFLAACARPEVTRATYQQGQDRADVVFTEESGASYNFVYHGYYLSSGEIKYDGEWSTGGCGTQCTRTYTNIAPGKHYIWAISYLPSGQYSEYSQAGVFDATAAPSPSPNAPPPGRDCITQAMLISINAATSYWGPCDASQGAKPSDRPNQDLDGLFCSDAHTKEINYVLNKMGVCDNRAAKINFVGQVAYETAYFSRFDQPLDSGKGPLHMLPQNAPYNIRRMKELFGADVANIDADFAARGTLIFKEVKYAWKSAAAWFRKGSLVGGCQDKDLFFTSWDEATRCILSFVNDRSFALNQATRVIV